MSLQEGDIVTCSVCVATFNVARAKSLLSTRRLKTHEVYQCPNCGYYVAVHRPVVAPTPQ